MTEQLTLSLYICIICRLLSKWDANENQSINILNYKYFYSSQCWGDRYDPVSQVTKQLNHKNLHRDIRETMWHQIEYKISFKSQSSSWNLIQALKDGQDLKFGYKSSFSFSNMKLHLMKHLEQRRECEYGLWVVESEGLIVDQKVPIE